MDSSCGLTPYRVRGCPIRRSSDHSSVCNSPTLFAAAHVLLRHSTPRHPPHASISFFLCPPSWPALQGMTVLARPPQITITHPPLGRVGLRLPGEVSH